MILYSVTVNVDDDISTDWLSWMKGIHIPDVISTGLFEGFRIYRILSRFDDETGITYSVQYFLRSMEDYDRYQREFAPALQNEHNQRYAGKFVAFRTILEEV